MYAAQRFEGLDRAPAQRKLQGTEKYLKGSLYCLRLGLLLQLISVVGLLIGYSLAVRIDKPVV